MRLDGTLAPLADLVLAMAGVDLEELAYQAMLDALPPEVLTLATPQEVMVVAPEITGSSFVSLDGALAFKVTSTLTVPAADLPRLIAAFSAVASP